MLYLLRLELPKTVYAGTTSPFFTVGNLIKVAPWLWLAQPSSDVWLLMDIALPAIPAGVHFVWMLHERLDQERLYRLCYGLLVVTALKLLWDGVSGSLS